MNERVLCPWCGAEMSDGWHENGLGRFGNYLCQECFAKSPDVEWPMGLPKEQFDMLNKAAALRRYTPPIKPMTLEETKNASEWAWIEDKIFACTSGYHSPDGVRGWAKALKESYGKTWRCWERKPTDEERSAAGWET